MGLFGKILALINVVAACAFLAFAARDYAKRQDAAYKVFRAELAITGLPMDAQDEQDRDLGGPSSEQIGPRLLDDVYTEATGGDRLGSTTEKPGTVLEEVARVRNRVKEAVASARAEDAKKNALKGFYLTQVRDMQEREKLAARLAPESKEAASKVAEELEQRFFDPVLGPLRSTGSTDAKSAWEKDPDARRVAVAQLLFNLAPGDNPWQTRVSAVVGLKAYIAAVDRSAAALADENAIARRVLRLDQLVFEPRYQQLIEDSRDLSDQLAAATRRYRKQEEDRNNHDALVKARQVEVTNFEGYLKDAREYTAAQLAAQTELEQRLFEVQRSFVQTQQGNDQLEKQLRELEAKYPRARPSSPER
jgi:hypothetical protein